MRQHRRSLLATVLAVACVLLAGALVPVVGAPACPTGRWAAARHDGADQQCFRLHVQQRAAAARRAVAALASGTGAQAPAPASPRPTTAATSESAQSSTADLTASTSAPTSGLPAGLTPTLPADLAPTLPADLAPSSAASPTARAVARSARTVDVGFSLGELVGAEPSTRARLLDAAVAAGATSVRFDLAWSTVEPRAGGPDDWATIDRVVADLRSRGLRLLPVIGYTPGWARDAGCGSLTCPPADPARFAAFVREAVQRYDGDDVVGWEIWNEPNAGSWAPRPDAARYAALLHAVAAEVRTTGTSAPVLVGGLAPAADGPSSASPVSFVRGLYAAGARGSFGGVAVHPYCFPALPGEGQDWSGWSQMVAVHEAMTVGGDGELGVWATEFGAPTQGRGAVASLSDRNDAAHPTHVDEQLQAATVTAAFAQVPSTPWLRSLIWYSLADLPGTGGDVDVRGYGLLDGQLAPKPALAAWVRAVDHLP